GGGDRAGARGQSDRALPGHRPPAHRWRRPGRAGPAAPRADRPRPPQGRRPGPGPAGAARRAALHRGGRRGDVRRPRRGRRRHRRDHRLARGGRLRRLVRAGAGHDPRGGPGRPGDRRGTGPRRGRAHVGGVPRGGGCVMRDLIAMGRTGVDIYPLDHGVPLEEVRTFEKFLGGSATNVAVAAARHGLDAALVTKTGADAFGRYVRAEADRLGVAVEHITPLSGEGPPTPVTFCEVHPPDDFPLYFYRYPTAPDLMLTEADLPLAEIREARVPAFTGTGLRREPSRATHHRALAARGSARHTVLDLDYRPMFWEHPEEATREVSAALEQVTIAIGNQQE